MSNFNKFSFMYIYYGLVLQILFQKLTPIIPSFWIFLILNFGFILKTIIKQLLIKYEVFNFINIFEQATECLEIIFPSIQDSHSNNRFLDILYFMIGTFIPCDKMHEKMLSFVRPKFLSKILKVIIFIITLPLKFIPGFLLAVILIIMIPILIVICKYIKSESDSVFDYIKNKLFSNDANIKI